MGMRTLRTTFLAIAGLAVFATATAAPTGNTAAGMQAFKTQCSICHATVPGKFGLGPSLAGVVGRKPGSLAGFNYSPAMKAAKGKWDKPALDRFLTDPRAAIPGNRMTFAGQKDAAKRADLIAYLVTLK